jgi:hypothetical protein
MKNHQDRPLQISRQSTIFVACMQAAMVIVDAVKNLTGCGIRLAALSSSQGCFPPSSLAPIGDYVALFLLLRPCCCLLCCSCCLLLLLQCTVLNS